MTRLVSLFMLVLVATWCVPSHATITNHSCYQTVTETNAAIAALVAGSPTLARSIDIGDSWDKTQAQGGNDIIALAITDTEHLVGKTRIVITCGLHAREYFSPQFCMDFAEELVADYASDPDINWILKYSEIFILPQANPDGRVIAEGQFAQAPVGSEAQRKNTNDSAGACTPPADPGIDLNRNFDSHWDTCTGGSCGSSDPCSEVYRGATVGSEPETSAVVNLLELAFPNIELPDNFPASEPMPDTTRGLYIDVHGGLIFPLGGSILWVWGHTATDAPNHDALEMLARRVASYGQSIVLPTDAQEAGQGFTADGAAGDYAYEKFGKPSIIYEPGGLMMPTCSNYTTLYDAYKEGTIEAIKSAQRGYVLAAEPVVTGIGVSPNPVTAGSNLTLTATVNSAQYCTTQACAIDPAEELFAHSAEFYWDQPPLLHSRYFQPADPVFLTPDTVLDSKSETFTKVITVPANMSVGQHSLFLRGRSGNCLIGVVTDPISIATQGCGHTIGEWGTISSVFITVN